MPPGDREGLSGGHPRRESPRFRSAVGRTPNRCLCFEDTSPRFTLGCPTCFGGSFRMAWGPPQQCLCFGSSLQAGFGVPLHWGFFPGWVWGVPPAVPVLWGFSPGWLWDPLYFGRCLQGDFRCPQQFSVLWGLPQECCDVPPDLGTPPMMALRFPPRCPQCCVVPPAVL